MGDFPMLKISADLFQGGSYLADGSLAGALRSMAQFQAKVKANTIAALTDNSGGAAADGTIGAIPLASTAPLTGDTCPTKAEVETALGTVKDALTELAAKVVTYAAAIPAFVPTNSIGGTTADGTIGAITAAFTGATSGRVALAGFNSCVTAAAYVLAEIARDVNVLCTACGVTPLVTTNLPTLTTFDNTYAALSTDTGTAAANGLTSITDAEGEATMAAFAAAIKEVATKLNALTDDTVPTLGAVAV
jgi:hypothetical protein